MLNEQTKQRIVELARMVESRIKFSRAYAGNDPVRQNDELAALIHSAEAFRLAQGNP